MQALNVEQVDGADHAEAASGQHDSAKAIEADPQAPWKLVGHIGYRAQTAEIANVG